MVQVVYRGISINEDNLLFLSTMMEVETPYFHDASSMRFLIWNNSDDYYLIIDWYDEYDNIYAKFAYFEFYSPEIREDFMWAFLNLVHIPTFLVETQDFAPARVLTIGFNDYDDDDSNDSQLYNELCE